jgi:hypothetical protein
MGGKDLQVPQQTVFDQAAGTLSTGHDPLADSPTQLADLGLPALLVGMWPTGLALAGALETAFGVAAQAHQNHSNNVQSTVKALAATGKNYQATEDETELAATRLRPLILSERDDTQA